MFSLNKNYPENLKLRQMVTDLIFWHKDIQKDELIEELITYHYQLLRDSVAQNLAHGSFVLRYEFEDFTGSDLESLDWLAGFGLIECELSCQRKPEKLEIESNSWSDDILKIKITPVGELIKFINDPSIENTLRIVSKIEKSIEKFKAYEDSGSDFGYINIRMEDQNGD